MRALLTISLLACAPLQIFASEPVNFSFEGFFLGMSRTEATEVRPEIAWQEVMKETPQAVFRKVFKARHLGQMAEAAVDLNSARSSVQRIGFTFSTSTDQQCTQEAIKALVQLEKLYGPETEISHEQPGKRALWITKSGISVRWFELCAVGARKYLVTYVQNGA